MGIIASNMNGLVPVVFAVVLDAAFLLLFIIALVSRSKGCAGAAGLLLIPSRSLAVFVLRTGVKIMSHRV